MKLDLPFLKFFQRKPAQPKGPVRDTVETVVVALALALVVRATIAESRFIPSGSMLPTLEIGDHLIVEKISYRFHPPQHGDIVVFNPPKTFEFGQGQLIKRVIGLAGERLAVHDGHVYRNGKPLDEPYVREEPSYRMPDPGNEAAYFHAGTEIVVPTNSVFVMGDNRNNSADGHVWGFLPVPNIIGRAAVRYWPLNRLGWPG